MFRNYDLSRYVLRSGCVTTHNLRGYAFLVRRAAFEEVGGFDSAFGRGYFEDTDLSRRLFQKGWWIGVRPGTNLHHEEHGSFAEVSRFREIMRENRERYFALHPAARRRVILATGRMRASEFPTELLAELGSILEEGGAVHWICAAQPDDLLSLDMHFSRLGAFEIFRVLRRQTKNRNPFTDLWVLEGVPGIPARILERRARARAVEIRRWSAS
jgi:hypothetical protein